MINRRIALLIFLLTILSTGIFAGAEGPLLKAPNQSPSFLLFPASHHISSEFDTGGKISLDVLLTYSGHYWGEHYGEYKLDQLMEMGGLYFDADWRLRENLTAGIEIPLFFRTENAFRQVSHRGMKDFYIDRVELKDRELYDNSIREFTVGDAVFYSFYEITGEKRMLPSLKVLGLIEIPTGEQSSGHSNGENDYGLGFTLSKNPASNLHTSLKITHLIPGELDGFNGIETQNYTALTGNVNYRINERWDGLFQACYNNSPFENLPVEKLASDTFFFTLGVNYTGEHNTYQLSFTEDLLESSVATPDYALNLRLIHRFSLED